MFRIETIIVFMGIMLFLLAMGIHIMKGIDHFLDKYREEREKEDYRL